MIRASASGVLYCSSVPAEHTSVGRQAVASGGYIIPQPTRLFMSLCGMLLASCCICPQRCTTSPTLGTMEPVGSLVPGLDGRRHLRDIYCMTPVAWPGRHYCSTAPGLVNPQYQGGQARDLHHQVLGSHALVLNCSSVSLGTHAVLRYATVIWECLLQ